MDELRAAVAGARAAPLVSQAKSRPFIAGAHRTDDGRAARTTPTAQQRSASRSSPRLRARRRWTGGCARTSFVRSSPTGAPSSRWRSFRWRLRASAAPRAAPPCCTTYLLTSRSMIAAAGGAVTVTRGNLVERRRWSPSTPRPTSRCFASQGEAEARRWATAGGEGARKVAVGGRSRAGSPRRARTVRRRRRRQQPGRSALTSAVVACSTARSTATAGDRAARRQRPAARRRRPAVWDHLRALRAGGPRGPRLRRA